jgi:uncharacterized protein YndB with AHSA1/START domain
MRLFKKLLVSLLVLIIVLVLVSFVLPKKQHVERSVDIAAPAAKIYPYLANPKLFSKWSPWSQLDPNMKVQFTGHELGKGAGMSWQSEQQNVGNGSWVITDAIENESLNIDMDFGDQGGATSFFALKPSSSSSDKTQVTWGFDVDAGNNPMMRWMGLLMDKMVGSEYQKGLRTLKGMVEK